MPIYGSAGHASSHSIGGSDALEAMSIGGGWTCQVSGRWVMPAHGAASNLTFAPNGSCLMQPWMVHATTSYDRIGLNHVTPGDAGALWRLGIYRIDPASTTAALVLDAGTIDATQPAGLYAITIDQELTPGLYGLAVATQGNVVNKPVCKVYNGVSGATIAHVVGSDTQSNAFNSPRQAFVASGLTGAFPSTVTCSTNVNVPCVQLRVK